MAKINYDASLSTLGVLSVMGAMTVAFFMALNWLMQPKVLENPGMAAYHPPPGTLLIPPPRKSDAPELAKLPEDSRASYAEAYTPPEPPKPAKPEVRERPKKTSPVRARRSPEQDRTYAQQRPQQQWGFGYGDRRAQPWSWF
jgi:hypothetical protein